MKKENQNFGNGTFHFRELTMTRPTDERLEKVEQISIDWETYKKTLKRNYLDNNYYSERQNRNFVLRLYPPFEAEMEAEYYESVYGRHYDNNWNEKPFHIRPEIILLEEADRNPFNWAEWPTETNVKNNIPEEDIEDIGGIDEALEESREWFWIEMKGFLPETFKLSYCMHSASGYKVDINWVGLDEE